MTLLQSIILEICPVRIFTKNSFNFPAVWRTRMTPPTTICLSPSLPASLQRRGEMKTRQSTSTRIPPRILLVSTLLLATGSLFSNPMILLFLLLRSPLMLPVTAGMLHRTPEADDCCRPSPTWSGSIATPVCSPVNSLWTSTRRCYAFCPLVRITPPCSASSSSLACHRG